MSRVVALLALGLFVEALLRGFGIRLLARDLVGELGDPLGEDECGRRLSPAFQGSQRADQEGNGVGDARVEATKPVRAPIGK